MNLKITLIIFLAMTFTSLSAQITSDSIPLYPRGEVPNMKLGDANRKEINDAPAFFYYPADKSKSNGSAIVVCPGGAYGGLAIGHEGHEIAEKFAENGIAAFVLKYRLPNDATMEDKSIGPLQDAQQALRYVRKNASLYKIEPQKIGIIGFSAGGHLASSAGVHYTDLKIDIPENTSVRPDFMLLIYPVISMDTGITHGGSRKNLLGEHPDEALSTYFSNELQVTKDTAPTLLVHAADDTAVPIENSQRFYEALQKNHVPSKLITYPNGGHGFGLNNQTTEDKWFDHALEWLRDLGY